jgi:hypothetical protein
MPFMYWMRVWYLFRNSDLRSSGLLIFAPHMSFEYFSLLGVWDEGDRVANCPLQLLKYCH